MFRDTDAPPNDFVDRFDTLDQRERVSRLRLARELNVGGTRVLLLRYDRTIERLAHGTHRNSPGTVHITQTRP